MVYYLVDNDLHVKGLLPDHPLDGRHADPQVVRVEHVELLHVHELIHVVLRHLEGGCKYVLGWRRRSYLSNLQETKSTSILYQRSTFHISSRLVRHLDITTNIVNTHIV